MIVTRSASRSTSLRMWLDSSTVVPAATRSATHVGEHLLHQRVQPGRRLVEHQQVDVGGERRDQRDLLPVALGVGPALLGRVEVEPLQQLLAAPGAGVGAAHPQQHVDRLAAATGSATAPRRRARRPAGGGSRRASRQGSSAEHARRAAVDAQQPEQRPDRRRLARRRSGRGSRAPRRPHRRGPARRGPGPAPNVLTRPRTSITSAADVSTGRA